MVEDRTLRKGDFRKILDGNLPMHPELDAYIKKQVVSRKSWREWETLGEKLATGVSEHDNDLFGEWKTVTSIIYKFYGESIRGY